MAVALHLVSPQHFEQSPRHTRERPKSVGEPTFFQSVVSMAAAQVRSGQGTHKRGSQPSSPRTVETSPFKKQELQKLIAQTSSASARALFSGMAAHRKPKVDFDASARMAISAFRREPFRAQSGLEGPTFVLVNPPCVLKLTTPQEIAFHYLYQALAFGFLTPRCEALDISRSLQFNSESVVKLSVDKTLAARLNFLKLGSLCGAEIDKRKTVLMHAEKLEGSNLFDFARYSYKKLSQEQRRQFFCTLGSLAMLDLFAGQYDRLVPASFDADSASYDLEFGNANMGNVMAAFSQGEASLFAIDNGIDPSLMANEAGRQGAYVSFLKSLLEMEDMEADLAARICEAMRQAVNENCSEPVWTKPADGKIENRSVVLKDFSEFLKDLSSLAPAALAQGLRSMRTHLRHNWREVFEEQKEHLDLLCPRLTAQLEKRFSLL